MMFKTAIFAAVLALVVGNQDVQPYFPNPYINVPGSLVFPQENQYFNGQFPYFFNPANHFKQYPFISLLNNQNQPLGYIYWVIPKIVPTQQHDFIPVRDQYGNFFGYYALNQYKPEQQFQPQILDEKIISQLGQFGFIYNQPNQDKFGFLVVKNPYVFYYNEKGVLKPSAIQYSKFKFQFPYNFFGQNYNGQYQYPSQYYFGQQYQRPYVPRYQGYYNPIYQFPYNYNQYVPAY